VVGEGVEFYQVVVVLLVAPAEDVDLAVVGL